MSAYSTLPPLATGRRFLRTGVIIGLAGGLAEVVVVWLYSAMTGGDAAMIARHVASAMGLDGGPAIVGVVVHMGLAAALGIALIVLVQTIPGRITSDRLILPFMLGSLAVVWAINFFVVLPTVSPGFAQLLPYAVTLASKLAFGMAAAATFRIKAANSPISRRLGD